MIQNGSRILYSSDINLKGGLITEPAETPQCDILIIEATFGTPRYRFPEKREIVGEMKDWAEEQIAKEKTPVFLGYSLGKGQELTRAFSKEFDVFVENSIYPFNKQTENLGIDLGEYSLWDENLKDQAELLIVPPHKARSLRRKGFSVAFVSGWAGNGWRSNRSISQNGFPLSDHSDFDGLIEFVEKVSPQVVYTTHGFASEFSGHLRERGFYSEPLSEVQTKLDNY
jgi:putative mRNA 3-end processing factor